MAETTAVANLPLAARALYSLALPMASASPWFCGAWVLYGFFALPSGFPKKLET